MLDYTQHTWAYGEEFTPDKMNNMEHGIKAASEAINEVNNNLPKAGNVFTYSDGKTVKMALMAEYVSDKSNCDHLYMFSTNKRADGSVIPKIFIDSEGFCPAMILPDSNTTGSDTQPVYLNDGYIAKCKYTLEASVPSDAKFTDTKNTSGTTNKTGAKLFLVGATSQAAAPQTYSNAKVYIGTDNELYSAGKKVAHHEDLDNKQSSLTRIAKLFSNVNISTQSSTGAYYTVLGNLADIIGSGKTLFGFWMADFGNCLGIITPYCDGTKVYVMSSTEQLNISVNIFFVYA